MLAVESDLDEKLAIEMVDFSDLEGVEKASNRGDVGLFVFFCAGCGKGCFWMACK